MSESTSYVVDPQSIEAYRIRVLFHCEELQRERNPTKRTTIALYLAEAATTLARLEAETSLKLTATAASPPDPDK